MLEVGGEGVGVDAVVGVEVPAELLVVTALTIPGLRQVLLEVPCPAGFGNVGQSKDP